MEGSLPVKVVLQRCLVAIANSNTTDPRKDLAVVDVLDTVQINTTWGKPALIKHCNNVVITRGLAGSNNRHLKRAIAASLEQGIGNAKGGQLGLEKNHSTPFRNCDFIDQVLIKLAPQHLCGCGITRARIPGADPEGFHPHQIIGQIGRLKTIADSTRFKP